MHQPAKSWIACGQETGFSLLEILVAFAILTMALGALYPVLSHGTQSAILADEYTRAVMIAESKLAEQGIESPLAAATFTGMEDEKYHWTSAITHYSAFDQPGVETSLHLYTVSVEVSWTSLGKQHSVELNTLKLLAGN